MESLADLFWAVFKWEMQRRTLPPRSRCYRRHPQSREFVSSGSHTSFHKEVEAVGVQRRCFPAGWTEPAGRNFAVEHRPTAAHLAVSVASDKFRVVDFNFAVKRKQRDHVFGELDGLMADTALAMNLGMVTESAIPLDSITPHALGKLHGVASDAIVSQWQYFDELSKSIRGRQWCWAYDVQAR